ncbi:hypothetical protein E4U53_004466, partial [Claviceps sorghi]
MYDCEKPEPAREFGVICLALVPTAEHARPGAALAHKCTLQSAEQVEDGGKRETCALQAADYRPPATEHHIKLARNSEHKHSYKHSFPTQRHLHCLDEKSKRETCSLTPSTSTYTAPAALRALYSHTEPVADERQEHVI